ncbi:hypothetical protein Q5752_002100 [Cryptotrichosporon argae]
MSSTSKSPVYDEREEGRGKRQLSCAAPCSHCIRRGCQSLCPNGIRVKRKASEQGSDVAELKDRLASLESLLAQALPQLIQQRASGASSSLAGAGIGPSKQRRVSVPDEAAYHASSSSPADSPYSLSDARAPGAQRGQAAADDAHATYGSRDRATHMSRRLPLVAREDGVRFDYGSPQFAAPNGGPAGRAEEQGGRQDGSSGDGGRGSRVAERGLPDEQSVREATDRRGAAEPRDGRDGRDEQGFGTLLIGRSGRSKWLGPTAGTEWLKDQEVGGTQTPVGAHSPLDPDVGDVAASARKVSSCLPFGRDRRLRGAVLSQRLPPVDEASALVDSYYRYYSWNHDVAPRRTFSRVFDSVYSSSLTSSSSASASAAAPAAATPDDPVHAQELALVFAILGMGALHNLDLPPGDPSADGYHALAEECLIAGDFLAHNTIVGVQALVIMAHYHLETDKGRTGDAAYPLWGLAMRIIVAMGLHRDGERWKLPPDVVEERRQVFWEVHTIDVFQANCFSRPSALRPEYIDTALPSQTWADGPSGVKAFRTLKYELCQISNAVLDQAMNVRASSYSAVTALYERLCAFERTIPFELRCRTALVVLPSMYPDPEAAIANSPEVNRRNLHRTFQQFQLSLNVSEAILFLQRPYFARALQDHPGDPTHSVYGASYLAVLERCNVMIQIVAGLYELYPGVTARHWFFWYHLFTAAVCVGTLVIKHPHNLLVSFALGQIDQAIALYTSVQALHRTPAAAQNLSWLVRLRARAVGKASSVGVGAGAAHEQPEEGEEGEDMALIGWRGRLIERGRERIDPHPLEQPSVGSAGADVARPPTKGLTSGTQPGLGLELDGEVNTATDQLLHQFWDPTILGGAGAPGDQPGLASTNWWSWDAWSSQAPSRASPGSFTQP